MALAMVGSANGALIGHWAFDEGTGTASADSSGNGNTGVFAGGITWDSGGPGGNFITLNGTDGSVNPSLNLPAFNSTNDFSWSVWANRGAGTGNEVIIGNRYNGVGTTDFAPRQFIKLTPTQFEWHQNGNGNDNIDIADLVAGEWHHHAITKEGTTLNYYLDGVFVQSSTLTETIGTESLPFFIGGNPGEPAGGEHFTGSLDDVRIYDNALTAAEVSALAQGIPEPSSLLLGALASECCFVVSDKQLDNLYIQVELQTTEHRASPPLTGLARFFSFSILTFRPCHHALSSLSSSRSF